MITLCIALYLAPFDTTPVDLQCTQVDINRVTLLASLAGDDSYEVTEDPVTHTVTLEFCDAWSP